MESPKITIHVVEKFAQNCKPKITSHNQTRIEKEKEEDEGAEDVRRRRKRKKRRNKKQAECGK